jgi:hypothetical protein
MRAASLGALQSQLPPAGARALPPLPAALPDPARRRLRGEPATLFGLAVKSITTAGQEGVGPSVSAGLKFDLSCFRSLRLGEHETQNAIFERGFDAIPIDVL